MKRLILLAALLPLTAQGENIDYSRQPLGEIRQNLYGPGVSADATGRAFRFKPGPLGAAPRTRQNRPGYVDWSEQPMGEIRQDAYGIGTGTDQTGRPFHAEPNDE